MPHQHIVVIKIAWDDGKITVLVTNLSAKILDASRVAKTCFDRWPLQELWLMQIYFDLAESHVIILPTDDYKHARRDRNPTKMILSKIFTEKAKAFTQRSRKAGQRHRKENPAGAAFAYSLRLRGFA